MRWLDNVIEAARMNLTQLREAVEEGLVCSGPWGHEESDTTKQRRLFLGLETGLWSYYTAYRPKHTKAEILLHSSMKTMEMMPSTANRH